MRDIYSDATSYINDVIIPALGQYAAHYDVEAITADMTAWHNAIDADGNINMSGSGLVERDDVDFWDVVAKHSHDNDAA